MGDPEKHDCDLCGGKQTVRVFPPWDECGLTGSLGCSRCGREQTRAALWRIEDALARIEQWQRAVYRPPDGR